MIVGSVFQSTPVLILVHDDMATATCRWRCRNERRRPLPSIATTPWHCSAKPAHKPLKRRPELLRIEHAEKLAERVMAGNAILKPEKPAQERLLRLREKGESSATR